MPIPASKGSKGSNGVAEVTVTSTKVRVVFEESAQVIDVLREDAPDYMVSGRQIVSLSGDNNKIFSAKPLGGSHFCKFIGFWSRDGEPPTPKKVEARSGTSAAGKPYKIPEHLEFTALFEIQKPKRWLRYQLSMNLFYAFSEYEGEITQIKGNGSQKLEETLEVIGLNFTTDNIPFSENVLPFLENLLISRNKTVVISVTPKGWVDSIVSSPDDDDDVDVEEVEEEVIEEPKPKVTPKQVVKAATDAGVADPELVNRLLAQLGFDIKE